MEESFAWLTARLDGPLAVCLLPLAVWILVSGLDDLVVLLAFLCRWFQSSDAGVTLSVGPGRSARIAIFVPCWKEDAVIGEMIRHNVSAIRYGDYDFFVGCYPNDRATVDAVRDIEERHPNAHLCLCPHDGPTSKADCLNWIYQRMLLLEEESRARFDIVLIHDAEDLIHPDELHWMNHYARDHDMIQVPVLPLPTPLHELTHGLYCDDFAECHTKDMVARQVLGGFIPSSGVGTGYTRRALETLATAESNRIFEPSCLTEDYENGLRLRQFGCRQIFVPIRFQNGAPMATREFFPRGFQGAVKQRTRWVTGIALQSWQRYGWSVGVRQLYWLWRDRKGLIGNPVSLLANLVALYGAATLLTAHALGEPWGLGAAVERPELAAMLLANLALQLLHVGIRMVCVARIYGLLFALGAPLRTLYGNILNSTATVFAVHTFFKARLLRRPLVWVKTEHAYPSRVALMPHKRPLEEILIGSAYLEPAQLAYARATKPAGVRLSEHLVHSGLLTEEELYEALSLQLGLVLGKFEPHEVRLRVARSLPIAVIRKWNVLPVKIEAGSLHLASTELPSDELHEVLRRFTRLDIRVQLVTPTNFHQLANALL